MTVKLGEVEAVMTSDVKKTEDLWAVVRLNMIDKTKEVSFKPAEDIAKDARIKITIEKI